MTNKTLAVLVAGFALLGCRTSISPVTRGEEQAAYVPEGGCNVRDFAAATDIPDGAQNLGWVEVENTGNDDETFVKLRQKVCEMGGDAISTPAWVHENGEYKANHLKANAWNLP